MRRSMRLGAPSYRNGVTETIAPPKCLHLTRCPACGEWRNPRRNILCICDELTCAVCGEGQIRKPISNFWDEADGKLWHTPWLGGYRSCPACGAGCVAAFWGQAAA